MANPVLLDAPQTVLGYKLADTADHLIVGGGVEARPALITPLAPTSPARLGLNIDDAVEQYPIDRRMKRRKFIARGSVLGESSAHINRLKVTIDQLCGYAVGKDTGDAMRLTSLLNDTLAQFRMLLIELRRIG